MRFGDPAVWAEAALGSADAQMAVCQMAVDAVAAGTIARDEGLVIAETMARLAFVQGNPAHRMKLACVLYSRSDCLAEQGDDEGARAYEIEATAELAIADEAGCADAGDILSAFAHLLKPQTVAFLSEHRDMIRRMAQTEAAA